jgi:hypothetical protein
MYIHTQPQSEEAPMADPKSQIHFEQAGLGSILSRYRLILPANQREYAWEERHVKQFIEDLAKAISDNEPGYFLGTVVTIPRPEEVLEVVDGQQRLATTSILLAAIRDYLLDKDDIAVEAINNTYLTGIDLQRRVRVTNLKLNIDDHELFSWLLTRTGDRPAVTKPSHQRLAAAHQTAAAQVKRIVAPYESKHHADELIKWVSFLKDKALVVLVRVPDGANAYKMFETLNDRGLKTSQADLIKNYLYGRAGARFSEVQARWSYMRSALESLGEGDITVSFLRHALTVQRGLVRESAVYETVQAMAASEGAALTCATNLENLANAYVATFNPENEKWNGYPDTVRRSIEVFNLLSIRPFRPLILAIANKFDKKETGLAFKFLVSLSVRLVITAGAASGSIDESAAATSLEIFTGKVKTAAALKKMLGDITPTDEAFREAFKVARVSQPKFARYYLRSLETASNGEKEPYFIPTDDRSIINLEHVLPKKPLNNFPKFTDEEADLWLNRLGNQVLMRASENSGAKSDSFKDKKLLYASSAYNLTKQIAENSDWTPQIIASRQVALAELASKTWPI